MDKVHLLVVVKARRRGVRGLEIDCSAAAFEDHNGGQASPFEDLCKELLKAQSSLVKRGSAYVRLRELSWTLSERGFAKTQSQFQDVLTLSV